MKIYLTGASGFIGRHLARAFRERGHLVVCAVHRAVPAAGSAPCRELQRVNYVTDVEPAAWLDRVRGAEIVVNAVGLIRERGADSFEALHSRAPIALFTAAASVGSRRVVQISALGADDHARSRFHRSKKAADDFLATLPVDWAVVRPSLVYGQDGQSARLFTTLAAMPLIAVPGGGGFEVQPVHIDDLVEAIVAVVEAPARQCRVIPLVGPRALRFDDFLAQIRQALGMRPARFIRIPRVLMRLIAGLLAYVPGSVLDPETLDMLFRGNTADVRATRELLHRQPRTVPEFLPVATASTQRSAAQLRWLLPILRWSVGLVWIGTGIVSIWVYPEADSFRLLARSGVSVAWAPFALYGAATLDIVIGLATLTSRPRPWLWLAQIALILGYTAIITVALPEFWAHPYGPVLKNLPMLAAIWMIYELEQR
jgi:uncharacterized protein YbjT (DUF2867 family)